MHLAKGLPPERTQWSRPGSPEQPARPESPPACATHRLSVKLGGLLDVPCLTCNVGLLIASPGLVKGAPAPTQTPKYQGRNIIESDFAFIALLIYDFKKKNN